MYFPSIHYTAHMIGELFKVYMDLLRFKILEKKDNCNSNFKKKHICFEPDVSSTVHHIPFSLDFHLYTNLAAKELQCISRSWPVDFCQNLYIKMDIGNNDVLIFYHFKYFLPCSYSSIN
jgi:hypothetical protein